jgi:branched-chain amino acid transport system ATP-binding protein
MLQVEDLSIAYDGANVVKGVSFAIAKSDSVALLGPNGAGKTSIARAIAGLVPFSGEISINQGTTCTSLKGLPAWSIARSGIVYIPETNAVYESLSVRENLTVAFAASSVQPAVARSLLVGIHERFPFLHQRPGQRAGTLSGGQKKLLAIARGLLVLRSLSASPDPPQFQLLIVDEPSHGLSPQAMDVVREALSGLGVSLLLIEQMARFALDVCARGYVLRNGRIIASGDTQAFRRDTLMQSYLGPLAESSSSPWTN